MSQTDTFIRARLPDRGELFLVSGPNPNPPTTDGWVQANLADDQKTDPNAKICVGPQEVTIQNGPKASGYIVCLTVVPQTGNAYEAYDLFNTQVDEQGKVVYQLEVWASKGTFDEVIAAVRTQISSTLVWKLFKP